MIYITIDDELNTIHSRKVESGKTISQRMSIMAHEIKPKDIKKEYKLIRDGILAEGYIIG